MIAKRKRAKGGGRKPKGPFSELTSPLSIRMPKSMREQLVSAAQASGKSLSQELLDRLSNTFDRDRDPGMRALCFLLPETAHQAVGIPVSDQLKSTNTLNWRNNPFFFRAFKIAVGTLLDALEPAGPITPPKMKFNFKPTSNNTTAAAGGALNDFIKSYETPEARGQHAAGYIWNSLQTIPHLSPDEREQDHPAFRHEFYGMSDAARDLHINDEEEKT